MKRTDLRELASSGAADKDVATYDAATNRWAPKAASAGSSSLTVQDENGTVATGVTQIDFQGAGVTVAGGTGEVVVTIPGGTGGGGSGGGVLATSAYDPATLAQYTTVPTTLAAIDAANLSIAFTAPASGKVLVRLQGLLRATNNTTALYWGLVDAAGAAVPGAVVQVVGGNAATSNITRPCEMLVTGLTPGASYTYRWAWKVSATGGTYTLYLGGGNGAGLMVVTAA